MPSEFCLRGHEIRIVGRNSQHRCNACERERNRARKRAGRDLRPCTHEGECMRIADRRGRSYCVAQRRTGFTHGERVRPVRDGFEDEYGPVPPQARGSAWVDRVVLERYVSGARVGRQLTQGESRALHLLSVLQGRDGPSQGQE